MFITMFATTCIFSLAWDRLIETKCSHSISLIYVYILILCSYLSLSLPLGFFLLVSRPKYFFLTLCVPHFPLIWSSFHWEPYNTLSVKIMKVIAKEFFSASCYFAAVRSKYFSQYLTTKQTLHTAFPLRQRPSLITTQQNKQIYNCAYFDICGW